MGKGKRSKNILWFSKQRRLSCQALDQARTHTGASLPWARDGTRSPRNVSALGSTRQISQRSTGTPLKRTQRQPRGNNFLSFLFSVVTTGMRPELCLNFGCVGNLPVAECGSRKLRAPIITFTLLQVLRCPIVV